MIDVSGLDTWTHPLPQSFLLTPFLSRSLYDAQPIFATGLTGAGRTVGVTSFDGFRSSNWLLYISHFGLPTPVGGPGTNITVVPVVGGGLGAGSASGEGDLDIQMEVGAAPLANIRIFDPSIHADLIAMLSAEASDNQCDAISDSYTWQLPNTTEIAAHNQHLSLNAEGITYMNASGDEGTNLDSFGFYPDCDPEVLSVGGTIANVDPVTGARLGEGNWGFGGGGWSTNSVAFNVRPSWQTGTGVPAIDATNNHRLVPDLAFHSSANNFSGAYEYYAGNALTKGTGTSFAAPVFAAQLQLVSLEGDQLRRTRPGHQRSSQVRPDPGSDLQPEQRSLDLVRRHLGHHQRKPARGPRPVAAARRVGHVRRLGPDERGRVRIRGRVRHGRLRDDTLDEPWLGPRGRHRDPRSGGRGHAGGQLAGPARADGGPAALVGAAVRVVREHAGAVQGRDAGAFPFVLTASLGTDATGAITLPFTFPVGVPSGTSLYFQYAAQDAAAPHGASLSNCERGLTP